MGNNAGAGSPGSGDSKAGAAKPNTGDKGKRRPGRKAKKGSAKKKKKKDKLKCGENGKYGDLKKKTGGGAFDRDHVPAKGALKEFARKELNNGEELCKLQKKAIDAVGNAIAIPGSVHKEYSPTYGGKNTPKRMSDDAADLKGAAERDTKDVSKGMKNPCKKKYDAWAKKIRKLTNKDYKKMLSKAIKPFKK